MIQIAINGNRNEAFIPRKTEEILKSAIAAIEKGADCIHFHPRDDKGCETLKAAFVDKQIKALREHLKEIPIGVSTGAWIEPNLVERLEQIKSWRILSDFVSINYDETGFEKVTTLITEKGIQIEAGLSDLKAAKNFTNIVSKGSFTRILIEPGEQRLELALDTVTKIEHQIVEAGIQLPILLHGTNKTCWDLLKLAFRKGYQTRIGFEDVLTLPDGKKARANSELLKHALLIKSQLLIGGQNLRA